MGTTVLSVKAHYELQTEAERAQAQGLIVDYYSAHDMVWEGVTTLAVDCRMIEDTTQRTTPKATNLASTCARVTRIRRDKMVSPWTTPTRPITRKWPDRGMTGKEHG